jgi:lipopolysaccharide export system ATP-binding protein
MKAERVNGGNYNLVVTQSVNSLQLPLDFKLEQSQIHPSQLPIYRYPICISVLLKYPWMSIIIPDNLFLQNMSLTIQTKDLVKVYGNRTVVNKVSFNVSQGEIVGLLGPNGAGKTTSFYQVVGLVKPDEGEVFLGDLNITRMPMYQRAQMGIGYLPQEASVFRKLSVEDNIAAVLEMTKLSKPEQKEKLEMLLEEFRLTQVRKNNGDTLSGGERRRTEIARALAVDPKFVLLDEPFAGVDPIAVEDIQEIIARLKYKNIGILITDHNVNETLSICDRAYLLIDGKIFKHGSAEELAQDEQVRRLYLGRNFELKRKDYLHLEAAKISKVKNAAESDLV